MKHLLLSTLFIISSLAHAGDKSSMDMLATPVMELFEKGEISNVASKALSGSVISDYISKADLAQTDSQIEGYIKVLGKFYSSKLLHEQGVEGIYISRWYILNFERQPALIKINFYKANKTWEINSVSLDLDLGEYIEAGGKFELKGLGVKSKKES
ncbi:MAG: hypothetical protein ACSHW0_19480 [Thalassotalea sp.]